MNNVCNPGSPLHDWFMFMGCDENKKSVKPRQNRRIYVFFIYLLFQELVAATPSQKNWAGIAISLFVICAVCGLILFSIYLLRPPDDGPRVKGRKIFLNDTTSKHFRGPPFNGSWISGTSYYTSRSRESLGLIS